MTALQRIQRAGFDVSLSGDIFTVSPASRLTTEQREFLKAHKAEIVEALAGSLKPSEWTDKTTGELKHGLNVTVSAALSAYDVKNRRGGSDTESGRPPQRPPQHSSYPDYDDPIPFGN